MNPIILQAFYDANKPPPVQTLADVRAEIRAVKKRNRALDKRLAELRRNPPRRPNSTIKAFSDSCSPSPISNSTVK